MPLLNAGALSVYIMHILYHHLELFRDIERENIHCIHSLCFTVRADCYDQPVSDCISYPDCKFSDLFQPSMLYDYSDFARVLHTLSRLSNCAKARARISGFPVQAGSTSGVATSHDEDQVRTGQPDLVAKFTQNLLNLAIWPLFGTVEKRARNIRINYFISIFFIVFLPELMKSAFSTFNNQRLPIYLNVALTYVNS